MKLLEILLSEDDYSIPELMLDPNFKKWVLLPISVMMVLTGLLKQNLLLLISPKYRGYPRVKLTESQWFMRGQMLLGNGTNLDDDSFESRRHEMINILSSGTYLAKQNKNNSNNGSNNTGESGVTNPFSDPNINDSLMTMAKGNMANFIPQTVIMWWVNYFFGGFVIMKLPFPLTIKFKDMLQNGVMTENLDVRWVSAISWYFISVLGMNPLYNLIQGSDEQQVINDNTTGNNTNQILGGPGQPAPETLMKNLANDLTIATRHESCFVNIESRVLKMYE
ncbi:ER membrane complex subunit EMC3 PWA37_003571 [Arxiozyma heterogenica]|uniref:ER membrane protein complex subunit 3 n=1 Tax=Arxiozyma heterogenica TaxID=278026 RepID=A0AAN7WPW8_9SACH|nr:hypothetical protein RI543_002039 [Kazachstania heterogenica]